MTDKILDLGRQDVEVLIEAVRSTTPVSDLTHDFYRYPARFSPWFARAVIQTFSKEGDVVVDPFMGGATTLVEARVLGRIGIGLDINELACFIARVKTTPLSQIDLEAVRSWIASTIPALNMHASPKRPQKWIARGYQRNIDTQQTWRIRKSLELALARVRLLETEVQQNFARAVLLKTAQWGLDCRSDVPTVARFRDQIKYFSEEMMTAVSDFELVEKGLRLRRLSTLILNRSAETIHEDPCVRAYGSPNLVVTSPPYPGVHVLYHRWQVLGRRETPAPFWISNTLDGSGSSFYGFGDRKQVSLRKYFETALAGFSSIARIVKPETTIVQLVAFSDASWQLPKYLQTMRAAGFMELKLRGMSGEKDRRLWREVPNRKWYADQRGARGAAKEVVLFHRLNPTTARPPLT